MADSKRPDLKLVTNDQASEVPEPEINYALAALHEYTNIVADDFGDDLAGFALVAIAKDGSTTGSYVLMHEAPIDLRIMPSVFHDILQSQVTQAEITDYVEGLRP